MTDPEPEPIRHTLIPLDDEGTFLLFGESDLPDISLLPVPYLTAADNDRVAHAIAMSCGVSNAAIQAWQASYSVRGLVKLAPETLAAMRAGSAPLVDGAWNLGTLQQGGKFVAQVRWAPAAGATAANALAAVGPAAALLAVQWQLNSISRKVERNIELTKTVLDELRSESWHELHAAAMSVTAEAALAMRVGEVTEGIWSNLQTGVEAQLRKHRSRHLENLRRRRDEFASLRKDKPRGVWLSDNYSELIRDTQAVLVAERGWAMYQLLRAAFLRKSPADVERQVAQHVLKEALREHEECLDLLDSTLRQLYVDLSLLLEADADRRVKVGGEKVLLRDIRNAVGDLHEQAAEGPLRAREPLKHPVLPVVPRAFDLAAARLWQHRARVRWLLEDDGRIELLARGDLHWDEWDARVLLVLTSKRVLFLDRRSLWEGRAVSVEIPLARLRVIAAGHPDGREKVKIGNESIWGSFWVDNDMTDRTAQILLAARKRWENKSGQRKDIGKGET